jgi:hypothetical protein
MEAYVLEYNSFTPKPRREPVLSKGACSRLSFEWSPQGGRFFVVIF